MDNVTSALRVSSVDELPAWDQLLNAEGMPLAAVGDVMSLLVLGRTVERNGSDDAQRIVLVVSENDYGKPAFISALTVLIGEGCEDPEILVAPISVLQVVVSQWAAKTGTISDSDSEAHAQWDLILSRSIRAGASDIHFDASHGRGVVKHRVLGELEKAGFETTQKKATSLASSMYNTMVDAGTTKGGFDPRTNQTASVTRSYDTGRVRLRYEHVPIEPDGISLTLRIIHLGVSSDNRHPKALGYSEDQLAAFTRIFSRASGMILFIGSTGSGKSTSAATFLTQLMRERPSKLLRTVEEPVELLIPGSNVTQTSVARSQVKDGNDSSVFLKVLSSMMRSDPDYLMVGEIRDSATAKLAIQAVRSGHLCVSTIHADSAVSAYDRLFGMGVARTDIASPGLVAGMAFQVLVPVLCSHCKVPASDVTDEAEFNGIMAQLRRKAEMDNRDPMSATDSVYFRSAKGCKECNGRSISSRTVCAELLTPTKDIISAIREGDLIKALECWRKTINADDPSDMTGRTAFEHACWKMDQGDISPLDVVMSFHPLDEAPF